MRGFLAVARREIIEHRVVFFAAGAASLLPLVAPILRGFHDLPARQARDGLAYLIASVSLIGLATTLGWIVLAGEISNRRLGFLFSRPLSSVAVWSGKLGGALAIMLAAGLITLTPTFVADGGALPQIDPGAPTLV